MTILHRLPIATSESLAKAYTDAELAILSNSLFTHWWSSQDRQDADGGGSWYDRKKGAEASLATQYPRFAITTLNGRDVLKTTPSPDPGPFLTTVDQVLPTGNWTIGVLSAGPGTSALSPILSIMGLTNNDGKCLRLSHRTSSIVALSTDASSTALLSASSVSAAPHFIEVAYNSVTNTAYLRIDNVSSGSAVLTGWSVGSRRLAFGAALSAAGTVYAYGRETGFAEIFVASESAVSVSTPRTLMNALIAERYPSITLA